MSLKKSRNIRVLRHRGIAFFVCHYAKKQIGAIKRVGVKRYMLSFLEKKVEKRLKRSSNKFQLLLEIYPKKFLNKSQYKTFRSAYKHFEENYKNIITISPLFFMKNLKKHIAWLESDTFKNQYGNIENLENLSKNTIGATMMSPQKDSRIDEFTPPPPLYC